MRSQSVMASNVADLGRRHAGRVGAAYQPAHARAHHDVHRDVVLLEPLEHPHMRDPARGAAAKRQADPRPGLFRLGLNAASGEGEDSQRRERCGDVATGSLHVDSGLTYRRHDSLSPVLPHTAPRRQCRGRQLTGTDRNLPGTLSRTHGSTPWFAGRPSSNCAGEAGHEMLALMFPLPRLAVAVIDEDADVRRVLGQLLSCTATWSMCFHRRRGTSTDTSTPTASSSAQVSPALLSSSRNV